MKKFGGEYFLVIVGAAAGFLISLLGGMINFTTVGGLLVKPFVFAMVWGGLVFIVKIVLQRFVPEMHAVMFEGSQDDGDGGSFPKGENLDVTVGDDSGSGGLSNDEDEISFDSLASGMENLEPSPDEPGAADMPKPKGDFNFPQEPKELAKAIRTVVSRDEKGEN